MICRSTESSECIIYNPKSVKVSLKSTVPRYKSCQQLKTLLKEVPASIGSTAVKVPQ